jgi:hypothetical protein
VTFHVLRSTHTTCQENSGLHIGYESVQVT